MQVQCQKKIVPLLSLANGNWLGDVPDELRGLSYAEKLLVAKVRKNWCIVRIDSGFHEMHASAVLFPNPVTKIYKALPPHRDEMDTVLAVIFRGPGKPTPEDLCQTPLLVRTSRVHAALQWLSINHEDYTEIDISETNLKSYVDNEIPVVIQYHPINDVTDPLSTATHADIEETGISEGPCPFMVHGVIVDELPIHDTDKLTAIAIAHLRDKSAVLSIGRGEPTSIFHNPQLSSSIPSAIPIWIRWNWRLSKYCSH